MSCAAVVIRTRRPATEWSGRWGRIPRWSAPISMPPVARTHRRLTWPRRTSGTPRLTQRAESNDKKSSARTDREALGCSRGDLTTKVHVAADQRCRPISRVITPGQRHDSVVVEPVMAGIRIRRRGPGHPRTRPGQVLGDKAYSNQAIQSHLRKRGIKATIPERRDQQANRVRLGSKGGRPPQFDPETYQQRNVVERCINKHKQFRAVATHYHKREYILTMPSASPDSRWERPHGQSVRSSRASHLHGSVATTPATPPTSAPAQSC
jgi:transposase